MPMPEMSTTRLPELKPCPFCGGAASLALCGFGTAKATCMDCGSEGAYSASQEEAVAAWNRRLPLPEQGGGEMNELLMDDDGENRAVRAFLRQYGVPGLTVEAMQRHMKNCGFPHWPDWVRQQAGHGLHLTKSGAQSWLRHLFALESAATPQERQGE